MGFRPRMTRAAVRALGLGVALGLLGCEPLSTATPSLRASPSAFGSGEASPANSGLVPSIDSGAAQLVGAKLGVGAEAVVATEDGAVVARRVGDVTEVDLVKFAGEAFTVTPLAKVTEPFPANAAYGSAYVVLCPGLYRSMYLFGARNDPRESILRLEGLDGLGGTIARNAWVFALAPDQDLSRPYQVMGKEPLPVAAGDRVTATTKCSTP